MVARAPTSSPTSSADLRIGELARATGYSDSTLRYYESIGLVRPLRRTSAGYRVYGATAVERLGFVRNAQSLGMRLDEIGKILAITDAGDAPCDHVLSVVDTELRQLDAQLARLTTLRHDLQALRRTLTAKAARGAPTTAQGCSCVTEIASRRS